MKTFSLLRRETAQRVLFLGATLSGLGLGIYCWVEPRPSARPEARPVPIVQPRDASQHFNGTVHFDILSKLLADDRRSAPPDKWLRELAVADASLRVETQTHPLVDQTVPDFTLPDHQGQPWNLSERVSRGPVVLVFYLGYYCNACVHHLFELHADVDRFHALGAEVVAVSGDAPESTQTQLERYGAFSFPVLADRDHRVAQSCGVFRPATASEPEVVLHGTFLVGRDGRVHWAHVGDTPFRNSKTLLYELARLEDKLPPLETKLAAAEEGMEKP